MPRARRARRPSPGPPPGPGARALALGLALASAALLSCEARGTLVVVLPDGPEDVVFVEMLVARSPEPSATGCAELLALPAPYHLQDVPLPEGWELVARHGLRPDGEEDEAPRLGALRHGDLVAVRARGAACVLLAHACTRVELRSRAQEVRLALEPPDGSEEVGCPELYRCDLGQPGECLAGECREPHHCPRPDDPHMSAWCSGDWRCMASRDADGDGLSRPDDCDDHDRAIPSLSGAPTCGAARDHDCDGVVDALDVCLPDPLPACNLYDLADVEGPPEGTDLVGLPVLDVFVSDNRLVALARTSTGIAVWRGTLSADGGIRQSGMLAVHGAGAPLRLAVLGDRAFVTTETALHIVDLTAPSMADSGYLGSLPLPAGQIFTTTGPLLASPPFLLALVPGLAGDAEILVWDASFGEPDFGWPVRLGQIRISSAMPGGLAVRGGTVYGFGGATRRLDCAPPEWRARPSDETDAMTCYSILHQEVFEAVATSPDGTVFVAARTTEAASSSRFLRRLRWSGSELVAEADGEGGDERISLAREGEAEPGPTRGLFVWGGSLGGDLLLRTSTGETGAPARLHLHPTGDLAAWTDVELGSPVLGVAGLGDRLFLAAGDGGLLVRRLVCAD